jgi:hypothetical protein
MWKAAVLATGYFLARNIHFERESVSSRCGCLIPAGVGTGVGVGNIAGGGGRGASARSYASFRLPPRKKRGGSDETEYGWFGVFLERRGDGGRMRRQL